MRQETRGRILNAAGPIFAEKGFRRTTVREICRAAGVNVASVNYYFGDKERLYIETIKRAKQLRNAQVPMPALRPESPPEERLKMFVRTMLTRLVHVEHSPWQAKLMMQEMLQPTRACDEVVEEYVRPEFDLLLQILAELVPDGTPAHRLQQLGFSVIGQCLFYRVAENVICRLVPAEQRAAGYSVGQLTEHICGLTLAAVGRRTPWPPELHKSEVSSSE